MELLTLTLNTVGTLLIAWAALSVHNKVLHEHKMDQHVYRKMRIEQKFGVLGMCLIVLSYAIKLFI